MKKSKGQLLVGAMILLAVLAIIIPVMVMYVQNEAKWSVKQGQSTNAFQLAEGALDRGFQKVIESTQSWKNIQAGQALPGMNFDTSFADLDGGTYAVSVTSGPENGEVTIVGVGKDKMGREVRSLKAVYANLLMSDISLAAAEGVTMNGNNIEVEWGGVSSPQAINIEDKDHPSYWSAANVIGDGTRGDKNGSAPPNCDSPNCWWWHSYYADLPPMPDIDFEAYKSSAIAAGNDPCGNAYYQSDPAATFTGNCDSLNGKTYYIEGNWSNFRSAIVGNIIIKGNLTFRNGSQHTVGDYLATVPPVAWKQYCNDWIYYHDNYDSSVNPLVPCFGDINNSYRASGKTKEIDPAIRGFMYIGGNLTLPNGGGSDDLLHGAIIVNGNANINSNSHCKIYYDPHVASNIMTTKINLVRKSWEGVTTQWPAALP
jgi:Tfp pilus assembly protein PilX